MRAAMVGAAALLISSTAMAEKAPELKNDDDKLSYIFGYQLGQRLASDGVNVNVDVYSKGVREGMDGAQFRLSQEEMQRVMDEFQKSSEERRNSLAELNRDAGKSFMAENRNKPGVTTLENGLQYKVIKKGDGSKPKATDTVKVHYRGTLIDGREFDSSYSRNEPATFPVNRVIPGWTAILQMMPVGSHYQVTIPSDMGYGERGAPPMIGPHSVLIFEIELLAIEG